MATPYWFLGLDSLMEFIAFTIAIAIAYQALKGYRLSNERTLLYLNMSFVLLCAGLLIQASTDLIVLVTPFHRGLLMLSRLGYTINFIAQVLAYGILAIAYILQTRNVTSQTVLPAVATPAILLFEHNALSELILVFLLVYITTQTALNYSVNKNSNALLVFAAFTSLTAGHVFFMLFTISQLFFPFAHLFQLLGFLLLLVMLLRVNQIS